MSEIPSWKKEQIAPFDPATGSLLHSPNDCIDTLWLDVSQPFHAKLKCKGYSSQQIQEVQKRNRSTRFFWYDVDGPAMYQMFMQDFFSLWGTGLLISKERVLSGYWKVVKKSQHYGIKFVGLKMRKNNE